MTFRIATTAGFRLQVGLKLARLFEMPERDFERQVRELEMDELFPRLREAGVLRIQPYPNARFFARRFDGRELKIADEGLPELMDGQGDIAKLIERVGRRRFEDCFLRDDVLSDEERAARCGIPILHARRLREFVDQLYVRAEFESLDPQSAPSGFYSAVAGIEVQDGRPVLGFFNREIWKGRYAVDRDRRAELQATLSPAEALHLARFIRKAELLNRRKTTLYRTLEAVIEEQAAYLATGDPDRRRPLTQRSIARRIGADPSVLNRLVSNKSVEMPWGLELPIRELMPSRKSLMRGHLYDLAMKNPHASDPSLSEAMTRLCGARLSADTIRKYRKELGLGAAGQRARALRAAPLESVAA